MASEAAMADGVPRIGRPQMVDGDGVPTRERLVAAAVDAFVEKGYEGATLGEIARAADVSPPAIYNHFSSKSEVFVEAARWALGRIERDGGLRDPRVLLQVDAPPEINRVRRILVELHAAALRNRDIDDLLREWQHDHIDQWVEAGFGSASKARAYYTLVQGLALIDALHVDRRDPEYTEIIARFADELLD